MPNAQITIVGLGLIGTSLGLALQKARTSFTIVGHDRELSVAREAARLGAVDKAEWNLIRAVEDADLVFLAIPVSGIRDTLQAIARDVKQGTLITDTASIKQPIMAWAEELLPAHVSFVGGDPVVRHIRRGQSEASADLFQGCPYCIVPAITADEQSVRTFVNLVSSLGAEPYFVDAVEHDGLMAGVYHLPVILSAAMVRATAQSPSEQDLRRVAGQGFRAITALPSSDPAALSDVCLTNRDNLVRWVDLLVTELHDWRDMVARGDRAQLEELFADIVVKRATWLGAPDAGSPVEVALENTGGGLRRLLFGSRPRDQRDQK